MPAIRLNLTVTYKLHLIPSGIFYADKISVIGNGVVVNPKSLVKELAYLKENNIITENLKISDRAHVILPYHIHLDQLQEEPKVTTRSVRRSKGLDQPIWIKLPESAFGSLIF